MNIRYFDRRHLHQWRNILRIRPPCGCKSLGIIKGHSVRTVIFHVPPILKRKKSCSYIWVIYFLFNFYQFFQLYLVIKGLLLPVCTSHFEPFLFAFLLLFLFSIPVEELNQNNTLISTGYGYWKYYMAMKYFWFALTSKFSLIHNSCSRKSSRSSSVRAYLNDTLLSNIHDRLR